MRMLSRSASLVLLLVASSCAQTSGDKGPAGTAGGGTVGSQLPTPEQVFQSGETKQVTQPSQLRMLGPAAGGGAALSLTPGLY